MKHSRIRARSVGRKYRVMPQKSNNPTHPATLRLKDFKYRNLNFLP